MDHSDVHPVDLFREYRDRFSVDSCMDFVHVVDSCSGMDFVRVVDSCSGLDSILVVDFFSAPVSGSFHGVDFIHCVLGRTNLVVCFDRHSIPHGEENSATLAVVVGCHVEVASLAVCPHSGVPQ